MVVQGVEANVVHQMVKVSPPANFTLPILKLGESFNAFMINALCRMLDLDKVIVIAGCTELEPFGSLQNQRQMDAKGEFRIEVLLELPSIPGLIKFVDGKMKSGKQYVEQVDAKTEDSVDHSQLIETYISVMVGMTDPFDLYNFVHPSEVGSFVGAGVGKMSSLLKMFRDCREEKDVVNTIADWIILLLFWKWHVTQFLEVRQSNTEVAAGREHPTSRTRKGFTESWGYGIQEFMFAKTAIQIGCRTYGIVAYTVTSIDKVG
ncbi:hypothetical protein BY996DRAFT_6427353 [Phakopsora pachyrhizi]|nr:hypothetical protein BY996DRAFT_6427353 [Phakopsora pachyrhizi]